MLLSAYPGDPRPLFPKKKKMKNEEKKRKGANARARGQERIGEAANAVLRKRPTSALLRRARGLRTSTRKNDKSRAASKNRSACFFFFSLSRLPRHRVSRKAQLGAPVRCGRGGISFFRSLRDVKLVVRGKSPPRVGALRLFAQFKRNDKRIRRRASVPRSRVGIFLSPCLSSQLLTPRSNFRAGLLAVRAKLRRDRCEGKKISTPIVGGIR